MSDNPLISVIIPIYNVEKYLPECVDSVLAQTYTNLEIILVDDGSPDNCPQMCDEYAAEDSRVKVIHKPNGGLSDARNAGIDMATGEYLTFVDSDDWVAPDMIEFLYSNLTSDKADISCCGHYRSYVGLNHLPKSNMPRPHQVLTNEEAVIMTNISGFAFSAWGKLYRKFIFDNVRYPVGKLYEDQWVIIDVFMAAGRISLDTTPKYYYRKRKGSIVRNDKVTISLLKLEMFENRQKRAEANYPGIIPVGEAALYRQYISVISSVLSDNKHGKTSANCETVSSLLRNMKENIIRLLRNPYLTAEEKLNLLILAINVRLHKPYIKFQSLVHFKRTLRRKKKKAIKRNEMVLFE